MSRVLVIIGVLLCSASVLAAEETAVQLEELDRKVQSLKSEMLDLSGEISRIEQQIYPEEARINLFVSLGAGDGFTPESVTVRIDDALVASHLYRQGEIRAMRGGGIQKLYSGYAVTGEHQVEVRFTARDAAGAVIEFSAARGFEKASRAAYIEARLQQPAGGEPVVTLEVR